MWCDDVEHDMTVVREVVIMLLGPYAINEKKPVVGHVADMVGWYVNLDTQLVTMVKHNLLRTLYDFMQVKAALPKRPSLLKKLKMAQ
jgi:hypothetical protein